MKEAIFQSTPFMLMLVTGSYLLGVWLYKRSKLALLHPCLICMVIIISTLLLLDIPYEKFEQGSQFIHFLLGPSVVALGLVLYDQIDHIKDNMVSIITAIAVGSVVGVASIIGLGLLMGVDKSIVSSLEPKSVTTPIAVSLSLTNGGIPGVTAVTVVICGILGAMIGPTVLKLIGIKSRVAKGLSMGAAAHGLGTARAMEIGAVEGAVSGLSIGLMGVMTSLAIPLVHWILS